jgi:hypothetical protein
MKYALTLLFLTALVFAQGAPSGTSDQSTLGNQGDQGTSSIPVDQESVRKAKAVLDQAIQALGGDAYLNWKTMTSEGRSYSFHHGEPNSLGTLFWGFKEFPDKGRLELTKKRDVIEIFNGDKGYEVTYKGVRNLDEKDELTPYLRRRHYSLDLVLRQWLHDPGIALFYDGQTVAAQKETDEVMIMNAKNEAVTLNFDINTHLPVRKSFAWRDPVDKQRNVEEEIYDNYRLIQAVQTPFDVTRTFNGDMAFQSFLTSASYNQPLDASLFDPKATTAKRR